MKKWITTILHISLVIIGYGQVKISGHVINEANASVSFATVSVSKNETVQTDEMGSFHFEVKALPCTVKVEHLQYKQLYVTINKKDQNILILSPKQTIIEEVEVNTGYYTVPRERTTGSFTVLDEKILNISTDNNILNRLEGLSNGLFFDKRGVSGEEQPSSPAIRIRGLSTIEGVTAPLIVLDNFPFYGDIQSINPNDVANVTVLRDAAAASIWGAQAGNGVIVITTKKAASNQPASISLNTSFQVGEKPDLYYNQSYLPAATVMDIERELFEKGSYVENDRTRLPRYVELLIQRRDGHITEHDFSKEEARFASNDLRREWLTHLYQEPYQKRYGLSLRTGGNSSSLSVTVNRDENIRTIMGNSDDRLTFGLQYDNEIISGLELQSALWYTRQQQRMNGEGYSTTNGTSIYEGLFDGEGEPEAVNSRGFRYAYLTKAPEAGLLDWMYRPVEDWKYLDNKRTSKDWRMNHRLKYQLSTNLVGSASYQYAEGGNKKYTLYDRNAHYVRNIVNRFTQPDGTRIIPHGDIMDYEMMEFSDVHTGRLQLNYDQSFGVRQDQWLSILLGGELNQHQTHVEPVTTYYNFDRESWVSTLAFDYTTRYATRPSGNASILHGFNYINRYINRNLSYFSNVGYGIIGKYTFSGSIRWDGSNLLGVKTNQKGTLLWSLGTGWDIKKQWAAEATWLGMLKMRVTHGVAGNIDKSQSHYPTITISGDDIVGGNVAGLTHPGNPSLSWEKVKTTNMALDWSLFNGKIGGTIDYYVKSASNLLSNFLVDPSTGVGANYKLNYADLRTNGLDLQINSNNRIFGILGWNTMLILNMTKNTVTRIENRKYTIGNYLSDPAPVLVDRSVDQIYVLPWYGLNPMDGMPLMMIDGALTSDKDKYQSYYLNFPIDQLEMAGTTVPRLFGSVFNNWTFGDFSLNCLISFRLGHVFRRQSIGPGQEYLLTSPVYHMDYFKRWQKPGDELYTDVPAWDQQSAPNQRGAVYQQSMALVSPADVIRLDNVTASYIIKQKWLKQIRTFIQVNNPGILWRANKYGIDPDYVNAFYPPSRTMTFGIQVEI